MANKQLLDEEEETKSPDVSSLLSRLYDEVLPKILEVEKKCDFLISNNGLDETYKKFLARGSEDSFMRPARKVCEFYGQPLSKLEDVVYWTGFSLSDQLHLDALFAYWSYKKMSFDVSLYSVSSSKGTKNK